MYLFILKTVFAKSKKRKEREKPRKSLLSISQGQTTGHSYKVG